MAENVPEPTAKPATAKTDEEHPGIKPLTRRGYKRLVRTESQISQALALGTEGLLARAKQRDEAASDYLSAEALVYFIRRSDRKKDQSARDALFRELFARCIRFFRGQFPGLDKATREDLQQEVLMKVVEDILAEDDRADFMEVRFWSYLKRRTISAYRSAFADTDKGKSLDSVYLDQGETEGRTRLELLTDKEINPEERAMLSEGLAKLPPRLREVFVLRHKVGMPIGSDNPEDDPPDKLTLALHFGCSGRTIRNWLRQADELLARLKEKADEEE